MYCGARMLRDMDVDSSLIPMFPQGGCLNSGISRWGIRVDRMSGYDGRMSRRERCPEGIKDSMARYQADDSAREVILDPADVSVC